LTLFDKSTFFAVNKDLSTTTDFQTTTLTGSQQLPAKQRVLKPIQGPVVPIPAVGRSSNRSAMVTQMQIESETDSAEESVPSISDEDAGILTKATEVPASDIAQVSTAGMMNVLL